MQSHPTMRSLLDWARPRESAMARLLGRFVRAESPSFDKTAVDRFGRIVAAEWKRRGASVTLLRQSHRGDHIRAEWHPRNNRARGQILVLGHLDTVYAVDALAAAGFVPKKRIVFLWTSDEEIGSETSRGVIESEARRSNAVLV